nr:MAG TPA: hypothetical protein [Caudoviricetes sp.]
MKIIQSDKNTRQSRLAQISALPHFHHCFMWLCSMWFSEKKH